jgi:hypothetical protein
MYIVALLPVKVIQDIRIRKTIEAHTPKILYSNQNMENLYFVELDSLTELKGARQNTLDIYITGLKIRYISIFKCIYSFLSQFNEEST